MGSKENGSEKGSGGEHEVCNEQLGREEEKKWYKEAYKNGSLL